MRGTRAGEIGVEEFLAARDWRGDLQLRLGAERIRLTTLERVYWPEEAITKAELLQYYLRAAPAMLPLLEGRPAILRRYPRGIDAPSFYQHDLRDPPPGVEVAALPQDGRTASYAVYRGPGSLLALVNLGNLEQHPWQSRVERIDRPDWLLVDLDPGGAGWTQVVRAARAVREALAALGLRAYLKTSGSEGLHLYVPLEPDYSFDRVRAVAEAVGRFAAERHPEAATVERAVRSRGPGRVYLDWLQNGYGKSLAAAYSARARAGATVSCPIAWEELEAGATTEDFTIRTVPERLAAGIDPWQGLASDAQRLP